MCGIAGIFSPTQPITAQQINTMLNPLTHRGPDDAGCYLADHIGIGNRRLSIIDLAHAHQPISNEDGSVWIVCNGEIYNYATLRQQLIQQGHQFKTEGDVEVIVHLYEQYGDDCVTHLRGMFAFAIWDKPRQKLFLARDHFGQKPLFYAQMGDNFYFASEIKAIIKASNHPPRLNLEAMHHYLSLRFIPPPQTMLQGIQKLPPAHTLTYQAGQCHIKRYWQLSFQNKAEQTEAEWVAGLREKLGETVATCLVSDVPVGAFLSGGMDSSMVVAMMAQASPTYFKTFAVGVEEQDFNELPYAKTVADYFQTEHVEACVGADVIRMLPEMIWHLDEPSDPIAACQYHAAELASRHVKVVMGGDGGDELFAGFDRYAGISYINYYAKIPRFLRHQLINPILKRLPDSFAYKNVTQKMRWVHELAKAPTQGERYAAATCFFRFTHTQKQALFTPPAWQNLHTLDSAQVIVDAFAAAPADNLLDKMLYADIVTRLPEHSLMLTDRMTMAHSVEARSPLLDHELAEYVATMPTHLKIRGRQLKYILREVAKDYLPESIVNRPKQGFMFPVAYWFQHELQDFLRGILLDSHFINAGIFNPQTITQLLDEHQQGRTDHHVRLWMLLNLTIWHRLYIEGAGMEEVSAWLGSYLES